MPRPPRRTRSPMRHACILLAALALGACGDSTEPRTPTAISMVSGDQQSASLNTTLTNPFVVVVTDQDGQALAGVTVTWAITAGGGTLNASSTVTDVNGQAQAIYTTGDVVGAGNVTATVSGLAAVSFAVTITAVTD